MWSRRPQWGTHLTLQPEGGTAAVAARRGPRGCPGALLYLQIVEDEEERLGGQALVELHGVRVRGWHLVVVGGRRAGVPGEVLSVGDGVLVPVPASPAVSGRHKAATPALTSLPPTARGSMGALSHLISQP